MADTDGAAEGVQNLHLDEVTGERVSKSELKKRQKQRAAEAKKAEKAAAAPPKPQRAEKTASAEEQEKELTPNQYFEIRSRAINKLRESHAPNPCVSHATTSDILTELTHLQLSSQVQCHNRPTPVP